MAVIFNSFEIIIRLISLKSTNLKPVIKVMRLLYTNLIVLTLFLTACISKFQIKNICNVQHPIFRAAALLTPVCRPTRGGLVSSNSAK